MSCFCFVQSTRLRVPLFTYIALNDTSSSDYYTRRITNKISIHLKFILADNVHYCTKAVEYYPGYIMFTMKGKFSCQAICQVLLILCFKLYQVLVLYIECWSPIHVKPKTIKWVCVAFRQARSIKVKDQMLVCSEWSDMSTSGLLFQ